MGETNTLIRTRTGRNLSPRSNLSSVSIGPGETAMHAFLGRLLMHYGIYRRYPLGRLPALRNAWRSAQPLLVALHRSRASRDWHQGQESSPAMIRARDHFAQR